MTRSAIVVMALVAVVGCGKKAESPAKPAPPPKAATTETANRELAVGSTMPDYKVRRLDGTPFDLKAERGKVVLLNLWATWCGPCRYEIPELEKLHKTLAGRGLEVVGVSVDEGKNAESEVKAFVAEQKMTYTVVLDPDARLANLFQTTVLPTTAIIDRQGKIVWKEFGIISTSDQKLLAALNKALG